MIPKSQLHDIREWWVRVQGSPYRNSVLRLIDSHIVALEKLEALQAETAPHAAALALLDTMEA